MKVAILGSGFGLYGYLPAVVIGCNEVVLLPERYREKLKSRSDVGDLAEKVEWGADEEDILNAADAVIVTQRPSDQVRWAAACLARSNIRRVLLEKPIAPNPTDAASLLEDLSRHGKTVRIGYTFRYTKWGQKLLSECTDHGLCGPIEIEWRFRAHHYRLNAQNWKRHISAGGGAIRFFGIHLIAMLAEMGYADVFASEVVSATPDEAERWGATFTGPGRSNFRVEVDSNSALEHFSLRSGGTLVELADPFSETFMGGGLDRRVGGLAELCQDFLHGPEATHPWYRASIDLWARTESVTKWIDKTGLETH